MINHLLNFSIDFVLYNYLWILLFGSALVLGLILELRRSA